MTVSDYAESRRISTQAVRSAIKRYTELDGHVSTEGKKFILDAFAVDYLDKNLRLRNVIDDGMALAFKEREVTLKDQLVQSVHDKCTEVDITRKKMLAYIKGLEKNLLEANKQADELLIKYMDEKFKSASEALQRTIKSLQLANETLKWELDCRKQALEEKDQRIAALESEKEQLNGTIDNLRAELKSMTDKYMEEASKSVIQKMFGKK